MPVFQAIRPYKPADRAKALEFLKDERAIDSPNHRIVMDDAGRGLALWVKPDAGEEAYLGPVLVAPTVTDRTLFYRLVAATAQAALDEGFKRAYFTIHDSRLLKRLQRDFDVDPEPAGWEPNTGKVVQWDIHVDLADALRQLKAVT